MHVHDVECTCISDLILSVFVCSTSYHDWYFVSPDFCPFATLKMPGDFKKCENCKKDNPLRRNSCKFCNHDFKKKRGRPVGTTRSASYAVGTSRGRPHNTAETDGYLVYKQGGRLPRPKMIVRPVESPLVKGVDVVLENLVEGPLARLK